MDSSMFLVGKCSVTPQIWPFLVGGGGVGGGGKRNPFEIQELNDRLIS